MFKTKMFVGLALVLGMGAAFGAAQHPAATVAFFKDGPYCVQARTSAPRKSLFRIAEQQETGYTTTTHYKQVPCAQASAPTQASPDGVIDGVRTTQPYVRSASETLGPTGAFVRAQLVIRPLIIGDYVAYAPQGGCWHIQRTLKGMGHASAADEAFSLDLPTTTLSIRSAKCPALIAATPKH
jgi:hypothetical protein